MSFYDIAPYLTGATEELGISAASIQEIAKTYVFNRKTARRRKLRWRCKRSLGWIPVRIQANRYKDGYFYYSKDIRVKLFDSYGLENYDLRSGSFFQDARRDWYLTLAVDVPVETINPSITSEIGIDLGLSTFATTSTGEKIESQRYYKELEPRIQTAQRANKKKLYASLHKRARNRRKDFLNKVSAKLTKENKLIVIGRIKPSNLQKTKLSKAVNDSGWYMFKVMLESKASRRQASFLEINEAWTSVTCSACKIRTGPQGLEGLRVREWKCSSCGALHDRDVNAAINILALGRQSLAEGASC